MRAPQEPRARGRACVTRRIAPSSSRNCRWRVAHCAGLLNVASTPSHPNTLTRPSWVATWGRGRAVSGQPYGWNSSLEGASTPSGTRGGAVHREQALHRVVAQAVGLLGDPGVAKPLGIERRGAAPNVCCNHRGALQAEPRCGRAAGPQCRSLRSRATRRALHAAGWGPCSPTSDCAEAGAMQELAHSCVQGWEGGRALRATTHLRQTQEPHCDSAPVRAFASPPLCGCWPSQLSLRGIHLRGY